uniref:RING-type domain-containing protein n=1 Tax=Trypanosoma vivax (strain Y486) TaxID=1055687 RepID=G0UCC9_TRYVY|nr:conserved hypothetical protein [Trypanosoma vivax Y486]
MVWHKKVKVTASLTGAAPRATAPLLSDVQEQTDAVLRDDSCTEDGSDASVFKEEEMTSDSDVEEDKQEELLWTCVKKNRPTGGVPSTWMQAGVLENEQQADAPRCYQDAWLSPYHMKVLHWMRLQEANARDITYKLHETTLPEAKGEKGFPKQILSCFKAPGGVLVSPLHMEAVRLLITLVEADLQQQKGEEEDLLRGSRLLSSRATLIVSPAGMRRTWINLLERSRVPPPRVLLYKSGGKGIEPLKIASAYDYVLVSHRQMETEPDPVTEFPGCLHSINWRRVILDQPHLKSYFNSMGSFLPTKVSASYRWVIVPALPVRLQRLYVIVRFLHVPQLRLWPVWFQRVNGTVNAAHRKAAAQLIQFIQGTMTASLKPDNGGGSGVERGEDEKSKDGEGDWRAVLPPDVAVIRVELSESEVMCVHSLTGRALKLFQRLDDQKKVCSGALRWLKFANDATLHTNVGMCALRRKQPVQVANTEERKRAFEKFVRTVSRKISKESATYWSTSKGRFLDGSFMNEDCGICRDIFTNPVILSCGHYFCRDCIEGHFSRRSVCPVCSNSSQIAVEIPEEVMSIAFDGTYAIDPVSWQPSSKTNALLEQIQAIHEEGKVVVFCASDSFLKHVQHVLKTRNVHGALYPVESSLKKREQVMRRFHGDAGNGDCKENGLHGNEEAQPSVRVLLVSLKACLRGECFGGASHYFLMQCTWSPVLEDNVFASIGNIKAKHAVRIAKFVAETPLEVKLHELCQLRRANDVAKRLKWTEVVELFNSCAHGPTPQ